MKEATPRLLGYWESPGAHRVWLHLLLAHSDIRIPQLQHPCSNSSIFKRGLKVFNNQETEENIEEEEKDSPRWKPEAKRNPLLSTVAEIQLCV